MNNSCKLCKIEQKICTEYLSERMIDNIKKDLGDNILEALSKMSDDELRMFKRKISVKAAQKKYKIVNREIVNEKNIKHSQKYYNKFEGDEKKEFLKKRGESAKRYIAKIKELRSSIGSEE